jgi:hypothetical protein
VDDLPAEDRVAHFGKGRRVLRRVRTQDHKVAVHPFRDASTTGRVAEALRRIRGERSKDLLAHSHYRLDVRFDFGDADVVGLKKPPHVNGRSPLRPKWLADSENSVPFHFAAFYPAPDQGRVVQDRRDVKDGRKSPARKHLFKLRSDLLRREFFRVKQARRKDVHVAVPEAGSYHLTSAVNYRGIGRDFDGCARPKGKNAPVVYKNRAVLDCLFCG